MRQEVKSFSLMGAVCWLPQLVRVSERTLVCGRAKSCRRGLGSRQRPFFVKTRLDRRQPVHFTVRCVGTVAARTCSGMGVQNTVDVGLPMSRSGHVGHGSAGRACTPKRACRWPCQVGSLEKPVQGGSLGLAATGGGAAVRGLGSLSQPCGGQHMPARTPGRSLDSAARARWLS